MTSRRRLGSFLAGLLLAACSTMPSPLPAPPASLAAETFAIEARFALKTERPGEARQSASGRLSWAHHRDRDFIRVASPTGQVLAELTITPQGARLRTAQGNEQQAADPAELLQRASGYALPLAHLPQWLRGNAPGASRQDHDERGRLRRLVDQGWFIDYEYPADPAISLPERITIRRDGELELRLRIEEWQAHEQ